MVNQCLWLLYYYISGYGSVGALPKQHLRHTKEHLKKMGLYDPNGRNNLVRGVR